jgi:C-lobe and N-lobe beta barrels of Tf-binding protein B
MGFLDSESDDFHGKAVTPFFGTIKSDTPVIDHAVFLGNFDSPPIDGPDPGGDPGGPPPGGSPDDFVPISWLTGSDTGFGRFYGSQYQGFGGMAQGGIVDIETDHSDFSGEWQLAGAGFRVPYTETAPHGNVDLEGFVIGVGENMTDPHLDPRFFMNQSTSEFTMTIDKDAGEITGSLSAVDFADNANFLSNISIGGGFGSAFVDDDLYIALLGSANGVHAAGDSGGLKKYGNHLAPTDPNVQLAEHITWGYWEIAYDDPAIQKPFHVHVPGSLWIAGQVTSEDKIQDLIQTSHVGHYDGKAIGAKTSPEHPGLMDMVGTVQMTIDFSPSSQSPVTGDIHFVEPDIHLAIENGTVGPTGFSGSFQNTLKSELNGAFFGPSADAVAGNFAAILEQETAISGVFGADVQ